jgi:hypothetical protein
MHPMLQAFPAWRKAYSPAPSKRVHPIAIQMQYK